MDGRHVVARGGAVTLVSTHGRQWEHSGRAMSAKVVHLRALHCTFWLDPHTAGPVVTHAPHGAHRGSTMSPWDQHLLDAQ